MIGILTYHIILMAQLFLVCRNKTVRIKELLQTFAVGATMGVFGNFIIQGISSHFFASSTIYYTIGPVSEEIFKIAFVAFLLYKTRMGKTATIEDGVLLGAAAGAGFGFTEDSVRAVGHGLSFMSQGFPGYDLSMMFQVATSWLPSERSLTTVVDNQFIVGHLVWTAFVGLGIGLTLRLKMKWRFLIPLFILAWVTIDHSLANEPTSILGFLYPLYGYGMGIRYAFTTLLIVAIVLDNRLINQFLPKDEKLLIPGEKKRSFLGEFSMTIFNFRFGFTHWKQLASYFSFRRQLAMAVSAQENTDEITKILARQKLCVIASARFGNASLEVSEGITRVWRGPTPSFLKLTVMQKVGLATIIVSSVSSLFVGFLLLFSVYFPHSVTLTIIQNPFFILLAILGYAVSALQFVEFYRKRRWQEKATVQDRVGSYANTVLVNSSVITGLIFVPGFFGRGHPLLGRVFFWGQFETFWNSLAGGQQWVGGTVSAAISFWPGVGNAKSFVDAVAGYDYVARQPVTGWNRVLAGVGAIPLVGNVVRGAQMSVRLARVIKAADAIDKVAGVINFDKAVRSDLRHAYDEIGKALTPIPVVQAKAYASNRVNMLEDWHRSGGLESTGHGSYSLPVSGKNVQVYVGKEGVHALGINGGDGIGQISVDSNNKSIMFDGISPEHGQSSGEFSSVSRSLQDKFPDHTVMQQHMYDDGFTRFDVVSPDGSKSQFYSVPTNSSYSPRVGSVGSR